MSKLKLQMTLYLLDDGSHIEIFCLHFSIEEGRGDMSCVYLFVTVYDRITLEKNWNLNYIHLKNIKKQS